MYWLIWPAYHRCACFFRVSCSRHVYRVSRRYGVRAGLIALSHRTKQCRSGSYAFSHPVTGAWLLQLPDGTQLRHCEVAAALKTTY
ncbi:MAG: membrane protein insertion efficiency factor YidD [Hymenobacter sp.]|nr:MAG: membrane protein insertion efficiency factor YidD [Hymenobacter sp.]